MVGLQLINSSSTGALLNCCLNPKARQSSEIAGRYPSQLCELEQLCTRILIVAMEYLSSTYHQGGWCESKKLQMTACLTTHESCLACMSCFGKQALKWTLKVDFFIAPGSPLLLYIEHWMILFKGYSFLTFNPQGVSL